MRLTKCDYAVIMAEKRSRMGLALLLPVVQHGLLIKKMRIIFGNLYVNTL